MSREGPILCDRCEAPVPDADVVVLHSLTHAIGHKDPRHRVDLCADCGKSFAVWFRTPAAQP